MAGLTSGKDGIAGKIRSIDGQFGLFRAAKFGIAGAVGFLVAELIIIVGLFSIFGNANVPSEIYASPTLLALNIIAFVIGVTVGFFINERITVRNQGEQTNTGVLNVGYRLLKFQGVYALGNAITIGVQLALLAFISLSPAIGNIIGAIIAFPVSYFFSMRVVWRISTSNRKNNDNAESKGTSSQKEVSQ